MSSSSSSSSAPKPVTKVSDIIEKLGCLLADADDVLARLERRYRLSDVEKLSEFVQEVSSGVGFLLSVEPGSSSVDLPLIDDQSSDGADYEDDSPLDEEESEEF